MFANGRRMFHVGAAELVDVRRTEIATRTDDGLELVLDGPVGCDVHQADFDDAVLVRKRQSGRLEANDGIGVVHRDGPLARAALACRSNAHTRATESEVTDLPQSEGSRATVDRRPSRR